MIIRERTGLVMLTGAAVLAALVALFFRDTRRSVHAHVAWDHPYVKRDLDAIVKDTLRLLVLRDPLSWELRPNASTGLEFELMERFARQQNLELLVVPVDHPDSMIMALQTGRGDVIAAQFTPDRERDGWMALTRPYGTVKPMLARLRDDHVGRGIQARPTLDTLFLSRWSPFVEAWAAEKGKEAKHIHRILPGTPEDQLMAVLLGTQQNAIVTDALAGCEGQRFPALEFTAGEGREEPLSFAIRTNAPKLLLQLDNWLASKGEVSFRLALLDSYMGRVPNAGALRERSMPARSDSISPFDQEFRQYGGGFGWKWQLLAAMAWKESRFDSTAVSNMGAQGIMQLMPRTAQHLGVDPSFAVGDHINAAKRYISRLDTIWMRAVPDRSQRLRFVLASYNAGVGHIIDAQRLAERLGLDPKRWEHNVERAVLLLAKPRYYMRPEMKNGFCKGSQVFHYVRDIVALYEQLTGLPQAVDPVEVSPEPALVE